MIPPHIGAGRSRAHPTYEWDRPMRTPTPRTILNDVWSEAVVEPVLDHNCAPISARGCAAAAYHAAVHALYALVRADVSGRLYPHDLQSARRADLVSFALAPCAWACGLRVGGVGNSGRLPHCSGHKSA